MEKVFKYNFQVRGNELDSFGHVNNAVFLNYLEQARWEILNKIGLLESFQASGGFLVVTECKIKYINELRIFDEASVETTMIRHGFFIVFKQKISMDDGKRRVAKASISCLFVDKDKNPQDIPDSVLEYIND